MRQLEREPDAFEAALLEERPVIDQSFAAQLDAWAAEGFPSAEGAPERTRPGGLAGYRAWLSGLNPRILFAPAAGLAMAAIIAIAVVGSGGPSGDDTGGAMLSSKSTQSSGRTAESEGDLGAAAAPTTTIEPDVIEDFPPPGTGDEALRPGQERIQEKTVSTTLSTDPSEVDDVADGVIEATERYDGIVVSSNVVTRDDRGRATFSLKIPAQNLSAFLSDVSDLADVTARNEGTLDITAPFVTAEERFDDAKAEVDSLVQRLSEADSDTEADGIKADLAVARGTLAAVRTELAKLKQRADFATVSLTVTGSGDNDGWGIGDAADDALSVLEDLAGAALIALAVIVPLGAIAAAIAFAASKLRRRRRESALDD